MYTTNIYVKFFEQKRRYAVSLFKQGFENVSCFNGLLVIPICDLYQAQRAMIDELDRYQIEKQQALQAIQTQQKKQRKEIIQKLERELLEKENDLKNRLLAEATESQMKDEARYQQQKDQMIAQIINEMRENYGC